MAKRHLICTCCGNDAGRWEQHWNRDTGYGICAPCVVWCMDRGESADDIKECYGIEGVNWGRAE